MKKFNVKIGEYYKEQVDGDIIQIVDIKNDGIDIMVSLRIIEDINNAWGHYDVGDIPKNNWLISTIWEYYIPYPNYNTPLWGAMNG